jgi:phosphoglycolate phosphatase
MNIQTKASGLVDNIGGIIFDLDGTLADTLLDIAAGVNHALASEGLPLAEPETIKGWVGEGYVVLMRRAAPSADEEQLRRLVKVGAAYYAQHATDQTCLYPGVMDLLKKLNGLDIPIAVLSNKPHPITGPTVEALCPGIQFRAVVGYKDEATKKPNPTLALEIASQMGLPADRVLFVGDSATDIATGRNAGMKVVAVTWGFRTREQLAEARPDVMVDRAGEILGLCGIR